MEGELCKAPIGEEALQSTHLYRGFTKHPTISVGKKTEMCVCVCTELIGASSSLLLCAKLPSIWALQRPLSMGGFVKHTHICMKETELVYEYICMLV